MFQEEAVALLQLFRYIEQNRAACLCALKSVGREHLKRFFEADIHTIIHRAVEEVGEEVGAAHGCTGRRKSKNSSAGAPRRSFGAHFLQKKRILCLTNGKVQGTINK